MEKTLNYLGTNRDDVIKAYRSLQENVKRLDFYVQNKTTNFEDVFGPEASLIRVKIRDNVLKLIRLDPLVSGTKAMDIYWRKGFYETIAAAKKLKMDKNGLWSDCEFAYMKGLLFNGMGHYHLLIMTLQEFEFSSREKVIHRIDFNAAHPYGFNDFPNKMSNKINKCLELDEWLNTAFYKCLMCLGDLSRYILDFSKEDGNVDLARRYYHQALITVKFRNGLPFNQLGSLATNINRDLTSAYYYLRSMTSIEKFEGAEANLKNLLYKNEKVYNSFNDEDLMEVDKAIVSLLHMTYVFIFQEGNDLSKICHQVLVTFYYCLNPGTDGSEGFDSNVNFDSEVGIDIVSLMLTLIQYLEDKGETSRLSLARAFLLALFSHCVFKLATDLKVRLFGLDAAIMEEQPKTQESGSSQDPSSAKDEKKKFRSRLDRFRRKRNKFVGSSEEEDSCLSDEEITSSVSDDDDDDEEDISPENSDQFTDSEDEAVVDEDDEEEEEEEEDPFEILTTMDLVKAMESHNLVPCVRLMCLWVMNSPDVVKEAGETSNILWERLDKISVVVDPDNEKYRANDLVSECFRDASMEKVVFAEDVRTRGLKLFENSHRDLDWTTYKKTNFIERGVYRIRQFLAFHNWLLKEKESKKKLNGILELKIKDKEDEKDEGKKKEEKKEVKVGEEDDEEDVGEENGGNEERKAVLMQNMARLWLQQEVKELEGKGRKGFGIYSPYVVVDHLAMVQHLRLVKDLVHTKRFAVIIPIAVVQELDSLKKTQNGARNAIRWLEKQFQEGNRWLRAQKKHECKSLDLIQYPKKKNKEAWHYFQIMECCNYFSGLRSGSVSAVTLLSASRGSGSITQGYSPIGLAKSINIRMENVDNFIKGVKKRKKNDSKS